MGYSIGIDVGGTFTDLLVVDAQGNKKFVKVPSTPEDPTVATMKALEKAASGENSTLMDFIPLVDRIIQGTTITTNLLLTGTYSKAGLLCTKGTRDVIRFRRGIKRHAFLQKEEPPRPLVNRRLCLGVDGRIDCEGKEVIPLNDADVYAAADKFREENVESVGIAFVFSPLNSLHEHRASEILEKELPGVYISQSHEILPKTKLYERTSTTLLNCIVAPGLQQYLKSLVGKLEANGLQGLLRIMQSNGGVMSAELATKFAVNTILSGPAAGPAAGIYYTGLHGCVNLITIDMGGTSFDYCLIRDGNPKLTTEMEIGEYALATPAIGIKTIGAGGGSIASVDPRGILQVGPESAGAEPGAACYGKGGEDATVTDADLTLGYLNPDYFLGGEVKLYPQLAEEAIRKGIADKLKIDVQEAAYAIYCVGNANMSQGIKALVIEQGYDPRDCVMVIAGGAGPVHGAAIASELGIPLMIVPKHSAFFCAVGLLMSNLRHEMVKTFVAPLDERLDCDQIDAMLSAIRDEGLMQLEKEGIPRDRMTVSYAADLQYSAQLHELEIPIPMTKGHFTNQDIISLVSDFHRMHELYYTYSVPGYPVECRFLKARVEGVVEKLSFSETPFLGEDAHAAQKGWREVLFQPGQLMKVAIYDGNKLGNGNKIAGPAIVEEPTTTIVVPPDYDIVCDAWGNYLMYRKVFSLEEVLANLGRRGSIKEGS